MILKVNFSMREAIIRADFNELNSKFEADFGQVYRFVSDEVPVYDGSYSLAPSVNEQIIETANKNRYLILRYQIILAVLPLQ